MFKELLELLTRFVMAVEAIASNLPIQLVDADPAGSASEKASPHTTAAETKSGPGKSQETSSASGASMPEAPTPGEDGKIPRAEQKKYYDALLAEIKKLDPSYIPPSRTKSVTLERLLEELIAGAGAPPAKTEDPVKDEPVEEQEDDGFNMLDDDDDEEVFEFDDLVAITEKCIGKYTQAVVKPIFEQMAPNKLKKLDPAEYPKFMARMRQLLETGK